MTKGPSVSPDWFDEDTDPADIPLDPVALDANALDRNGRRDAAVDRFLSLVSAGRVSCRIGQGVSSEWRDARPAREIAAVSIIPPRHAPLTAAEHIARIRVRAILCGNAQPGKHDADALHLAEAAEAGCRAFITHDGRILRKRADLERIALPGMKIFVLEEFLERFDGETD